MTTPDNTLRNCKHEGYISIISWQTADCCSDSYKICGTHPLRLYWTDVRVSFFIYFCCASHTCPSLFIYFLVVETNYVTPLPSKASNVAHSHIMITSQTSGKSLWMINRWGTYESQRADLFNFYQSENKLAIFQSSISLVNVIYPLVMIPNTPMLILTSTNQILN